MAAINEAFRVLRDPGRRALYDAGLRPAAPAPTSAGGAGRRAAEDDDDADFVPMAPAARFAIPLPWLLVLGVLGLIFVFTAYATSSAGRGRGDDVDGVLRAGSCVRLRDGGVAVEVSCTGPNDGKVLAVPPLHSPCPPGGEPYTDQLGLVRVCVRLGG